jgi:hypothetical protein
LANATSIVVLDKFLYVTDKVKGLFVLKTSPIGNGYQDEPKKIDLPIGLKNIRGVTVFRASAHSIFIYLFTLLLALMSYLLL